MVESNENRQRLMRRYQRWQKTKPYRNALSAIQQSGRAADKRASSSRGLAIAALKPSSDEKPISKPNENRREQGIVQHKSRPMIATRQLGKLQRLHIAHNDTESSSFGKREIKRFIDSDRLRVTTHKKGSSLTTETRSIPLEIPLILVLHNVYYLPRISGVVRIY